MYLLHEDNASFTELMKECDLDSMWHCGTMGYHLNLLIAEGVLVKEDGRYELSNYGLEIANLLCNIEKMEFKKEMVKRTVMTFGSGSSLRECAGTLAKHALRGDKVVTVVEWDLPEGARRTEMMNAAKEIIGVSGVVSLADFGVPQIVGENDPFMEDILVPALITVIQEIRPNIIMTFDPGTSITPTVLETIGRCVHRAVEHATWPYWRGPKNLRSLEEYPTLYYWVRMEGNYIVDISDVIENKKEYIALVLHRFQPEKYGSIEEAYRRADKIPDFEIFKIAPFVGYRMMRTQRMEKHEYLK